MLAAFADARSQGDLEARTVLRLVCRSWRRAHDLRFVDSMRPRALHEDVLPYRFPNLARCAPEGHTAHSLAPRVAPSPALPRTI